MGFFGLRRSNDISLSPVIIGVLLFLNAASGHVCAQSSASGWHQCYCNGRYFPPPQPPNVDCRTYCSRVAPQQAPRVYVPPPAQGGSPSYSGGTTAAPEPTPEEQLQQNLQEFRARTAAEVEQEQQTHQQRLSDEANEDQQEFERRKQNASDQVRLPSSGTPHEQLRAVPGAVPEALKDSHLASSGARRPGIDEIRVPSPVHTTDPGAYAQPSSYEVAEKKQREIAMVHQSNYLDDALASLRAGNITDTLVYVDKSNAAWKEWRRLNEEVQSLQDERLKRGMKELVQDSSYAAKWQVALDNARAREMKEFAAQNAEHEALMRQLSQWPAGPATSEQKHALAEHLRLEQSNTLWTSVRELEAEQTRLLTEAAQKQAQPQP